MWEEVGPDRADVRKDKGDLVDEVRQALLASWWPSLLLPCCRCAMLIQEARHWPKTRL